MRPAFLIGLCILCQSLASADVTIQNSYYTTGGECREDTFLHNMDYLNTVSIDQASFYADSQANASDESPASLWHNIQIDPYGKSQTLDLKLNGKDIGCNKQLSVGSAAVTYSLSSGNVRNDLQVLTAHLKEDINLINSRYSGELRVANGNFFSSGNGLSFIDSESGFTHDIEVLYLGRQFKISSFLNSYGSSSGGEPVNYEWNGFAATGRRAVGGISILAHQGNRNVESAISGTSTTLSDKYAPPSYEPPDRQPAEMSPGTGALLQLYMQYAINGTV